MSRFKNNKNQNKGNEAYKKIVEEIINIERDLLQKIHIDEEKERKSNAKRERNSEGTDKGIEVLLRKPRKKKKRKISEKTIKTKRTKR